MPLCPTCDNRPFATKEALLQHVRTSSNPHPFCLACDRRFSSELAYNAHMAAKHPPTFDCLKCGKQYSSQFALEGHYRGHADHPNCPVCGKGFYDVEALTAHVREIHNDVWCDTCNLRFDTATAANEHYVMSPAHPKCRVCALNFRDEEALQKHMRSHESTATNGKAPSPSASTLGGPETPTLRSPSYTSSARSYQSPPTSAASSTVFSPPTSTSSQPKDLPPLQPNPVHGFVSSPPMGFVGVGAQMARNGGTATLGGTGFSPLSPKPNIFNKDLRRVAAIDTTIRADSPDISQMMSLQASPLLNVEAPVFSPVGLPRPGKQVDELWSSRENVQVLRNRLPRQPSVQMPPSAALPQTWNGAAAGPTMPNNVSSQQLVPFSQPYRFQPLPPRHRASSDFGDGQTPTLSNFSPLGGPRRDSTGSESWVNSVRAEYNFNPRLYPGSARHAATQALTGANNSQAVVRTNRSAINSSTPPTAPSSALVSAFNPSFESSFRQHPSSLLSLPLPFSPPKRQNSAIRISSPQTTPTEDKQEGERTPDSENFPAEPIVEEQPQKAPFDNSISAFSAVSTPRFVSDVPLHDFGVKPGNGSGPNAESSLPSPFSTDLSTISSPSSGRVRMSSPTPTGKRQRQSSRSRSRATSSARSDISSLSIPAYKVTESSQQGSPVSPDVVSPAGLAALPIISPLGPSPIDLDTSFDIPEARQPLPDSPPLSPFTAHESLDDQSPQSSLTKPVEGPQSRSTSRLGIPLEDEGILFAPANGNGSIRFYDNYPELSSPSSPRSFVTSHQELQEEMQDTLATDLGGDQSRSSSRAASVRSDPVAPEILHEAGPDVTVWSPSPASSPAPATPKAEEDIILVPEVTSSTQLNTSFSKQHRLVAPSLGVTPNISIASTSVSEGIGGAGSSSSLPSLQCRACRRETPDDITATMCGHVFCNRCIVDAVIKTSRCPFCSTPTLLYCLFRLDLTT